MTSLNLPEKLEIRLEEIAMLAKRSKDAVIQETLENHLEDMEDLYIALERLADPDPTYYTTEQVLKAIEENAKKK